MEEIEISLGQSLGQSQKDIEVQKQAFKALEISSPIFCGSGCCVFMKVEE